MLTEQCNKHFAYLPIPSGSFPIWVEVCERSVDNGSLSSEHGGARATVGVLQTEISAAYRGRGQRVDSG